MEEYQSSEPGCHEELRTEIRDDIMSDNPSNDHEASNTVSETLVTNQQLSSDNMSPAEEHMSNAHNRSSPWPFGSDDLSSSHESQEAATAIVGRATTPPELKAIRRANQLLREARLLLFGPEPSPDSRVSPSSNESESDTEKARSLLTEAINLLEHMSGLPASWSIRQEREDVREAVEREEDQEVVDMDLDDESDGELAVLKARVEGLEKRKLELLGWLREASIDIDDEEEPSR